MAINMDNSTITITFGEQIENHVGMQKIGQIAEKGYNRRNLLKVQEYFKKKNCDSEIINLHEYLDEYDDNDKAYLLIIPNGVNAIADSDDMFEEQRILNHDKKVYMYGRVVNKHARYNLCFDTKEQEPDYAAKKGRIVSWTDVPETNKVKTVFSKLINGNVDLKAEGNYYHKTDKCGISYHGDSERKRVIGVRLGQSMELHFHWYHKRERIGRRYKVTLNHGDIYIMSEKATGFDWKSSSKRTLRHAAGCDKFTK